MTPGHISDKTRTGEIEPRLGLAVGVWKVAVA